MKKNTLVSGFLVLLSILLISACSTSKVKLSPMQIRQITTRLIESDYENVYRASLTVIQDQGYVIKNTDMDSGLIVASVDRKTKAGSQIAQALFLGYVPSKGKEFELSCMVNKLSEKSTEIRLNIHETEYGESSWLSGTSKQDSKQIYDQKLFADLFNEIEIEVKRREAIKN